MSTTPKMSDEYAKVRTPDEQAKAKEEARVAKEARLAADEAFHVLMYPVMLEQTLQQDLAASHVEGVGTDADLTRFYRRLYPTMHNRSSTTTTYADGTRVLRTSEAPVALRRGK